MIASAPEIYIGQKEMCHWTAFQDSSGSAKQKVAIMTHLIPPVQRGTDLLCPLCKMEKRHPTVFEILYHAYRKMVIRICLKYILAD